MLNYDVFNSLYGFSIEAKEAAKNQYILDEIKRRQTRLKEKDDAIAELKYERDLISQDIVSTIREDLNYSCINLFNFLNLGDMFFHAWRYANNHNDVTFYTDEKVKEEEKQSYEFISQVIEEKILKNNKEFKRVDSVIDYCYSLYYEFTYKIRGHEIYICIPNFNLASEKTYQELLHGYIIRYQESEYCIGAICSDIDYTKIYDKLMTWINENWPKSKKKRQQ